MAVTPGLVHSYAARLLATEVLPIRRRWSMTCSNRVSIYLRDRLQGTEGEDG
jgi:hypothetical protein